MYSSVTCLYVKISSVLIVWSLICAVFVNGLAEISVYSSSSHQQIDGNYFGVVAHALPSIPMEGFVGMIVYASPADACSPIVTPPAPPIPPFTGSKLTYKWIALIARGNCTFENKTRFAQYSGYHLALIHNNSSDISNMSIQNTTGINIAAISISLQDGLKFKHDYQYRNNVYVIIDDDSNFPFDLNADLLIPFAVVVAICSVTMIAFMICKCIRDRRRARRHRLPASSLRKIPIEKYTKGSPYEMCAICLDDYVEGEKLRVLPCSHAYHTKCIDPWLTRNRRVCPICKRKVFAADETPIDDSGSDTDHSDNDERTPLVRQDVITHQPIPSSRSNMLRPYMLSRERVLVNLRIAEALRRAQRVRQGSADSSSSNGSTSSGESVGSRHADGESQQHRQQRQQLVHPQPVHVVRSVNSFDDDLMDVSPTSSIYSYNSTAVRAPSSDSQLPHPNEATSDTRSQNSHGADVVVVGQQSNEDNVPA